MIDSENNNSPKKRFFSEIFSNLGEIKKPKKENTSYELNIMNEDNEIPKKKKVRILRNLKHFLKYPKKILLRLNPSIRVLLLAKRKFLLRH